MGSRDPGEKFIESLTTTRPEQIANTENVDVPDEEDFDDDRSAFTIKTIDNTSRTDIYGLPERPLSEEEVAEPAREHDYNQVDTSFPSPENASSTAAGGMATQPLLHPHVPPEPTPTRVTMRQQRGGGEG